MQKKGRVMRAPFLANCFYRRLFRPFDRQPRPPECFAIQRTRPRQDQRVVERPECQRTGQTHLESEQPGHGGVVKEEILKTEALDPCDAVAVEAVGQADKDIDTERPGNFLGEKSGQAATMGIAAADQFAGDPAERIGMVAAVVAGRPVRLLCGDGGADCLLVGNIIQR